MKMMRNFVAAFATIVALSFGGVALAATATPPATKGNLTCCDKKHACEKCTTAATDCKDCGKGDCKTCCKDGCDKCDKCAASCKDCCKGDCKTCCKDGCDKCGKSAAKKDCAKECCAKKN